ncbi:ABC transporter permease subunit [Hungatella sp.]|uniref:ABC transporter permease n=1 Tax=Hungatella sp. TaxID=2613924 RepID=UPI002A7F88C7|nr:ABC transporter permease subunit [Hungatella sp.]
MIKKKKRRNSTWQFWAIILIPLVLVFVFNYIPMFGVIIAFEDFSPRKGILGSDWVGLKYVIQFLTSQSSTKVIKNTFILGIYQLIFTFPVPIILAVSLNECRSRHIKKFVQLITYAPYFISTVVLVGILMQVTDMRIGIINRIIGIFNIGPINFFGDKDLFRGLFVGSGIWQTMGYSAVIYLASLAGVSMELKEAAICDGANRLKRICHVDIPGIFPTIVTMFIFNCGNIINIGFEKAYLMQNSVNMPKSELISTFVYKVGLSNANYSFATAAGLFNSVISFVLLIIVNQISKKLADTSLF